MFPAFFSFQILKEILTSLMDGHVTYKLGGKVWRPGRVEPQDISELDCSGFTEYVLYRSTATNVNMPSGSSRQEDWIEERFPRCNYDTDARLCDGHVRIAFRDRRRRLIRHVWFVINGWTVECTNRGDRDGPTSFLWTERADQADDCFLLGPMLPMVFDATWIPAVAGQVTSI